MKGNIVPSCQQPRYLPLSSIWCSSQGFLLPCLGSALSYFSCMGVFWFCFAFFFFLSSFCPRQRLPAKARVVQLPPSAPAPPKGCHLSPAESPATSGITGLKLKEGSPQALVVWAVNSTSKTTETRSVYGEASETERLSTERSVQNLRRLASDSKIMPTGLHKALCD